MTAGKGRAVPSFRHILCPIDFSETSARALTYATAFARWYEARLTVLHVTMASNEPPEPAPARGGLRGDPASSDDIIVRLRASIEEADATARDARPLVQKGCASQVIAAWGDTMNVDLVVMGTHGLSGLHRLLLGSVTEKVVRTATCPVLTVPPLVPAAGPGPVSFKKIVAGEII